jgi:polysaccharide biosynthesis/export protein
MKNLKIYIYLIGLFFILLSSCTTNRNIIYLRGIEDEIVQKNEGLNVYKIQPKDLLYIKIITDNTEITNQYNTWNIANSPAYSDASLYIQGYTVSDSGYVVLPIIGRVKITGLTVEQATDEVTKAAQKYLVNPIVTVKLAYFKISILGEVNSPGLFSVYQEKINIFHALALAGDINDNGNKRSLLVLRNAAGSISSYRIDLTDKNILNTELYNLMPNDIVYVEPVKAKAYRIINAPSIQIMLSTISTTILVLTFMLNKVI